MRREIDIVQTQRNTTQSRVPLCFPLYALLPLLFSPHASSLTMYLPTHLGTFAPPQPDRLAVLLQLGNQLVALLHDVRVLLVLVVRPVGLDDTLARHAVDGARDALGGDELGQVAGRES